MSILGRFRYPIKLLAAYLLHYAGILWLCRRLTRRGCAIVLTYHRVLPPAEWARSFSSDAIIVTPGTFSRQMRFLRRRFHPLTLEQFTRHLEQRRPFPANACVVTFDDGWRDNHDYAYGILQQEGVPATVFVPTAFVGSARGFWQERLSRLVYMVYRTPSLHRHSVVTEMKLGHLLKLPAKRARSEVKRYVRSFKDAGPDVVDGMIERLSRAVSKHEASDTEGVDGFLDWPQVWHMKRGGVSFGAHGTTHATLPRLPAAKIRGELLESRETIRRETTATVDALAYPNGDYDDETAALAREAGFRLAFTTSRGVIRATDDPYTLKRVNIHEDATRHIPLFHAILTGVF
jgi:peptidoglycan/xylan/chitin deacetylase (PgdA/CDA1 family)